MTAGVKQEGFDRSLWRFLRFVRFYVLLIFHTRALCGSWEFFLVEGCFTQEFVSAARFRRLRPSGAAFGPFDDITGRPRFVGQSNASIRNWVDQSHDYGHVVLISWLRWCRKAGLTTERTFLSSCFSPGCYIRARTKLRGYRRFEIWLC